MIPSNAPHQISASFGSILALTAEWMASLVPKGLYWLRNSLIVSNPLIKIIHKFLFQMTSQLVKSLNMLTTALMTGKQVTE